MKRLIITVLALAAALAGPVSLYAQTGPVVYDDDSGGSCTVSGPAGDQVIYCTDLRPGRGVAVMDPGAAPVSAVVPAAPAPAPDVAAAPAPTDTAVASPTDQDADNAPDELEPGLGLDPTNPDTDADGVADGDEGNIYGTDPLAADTDGDGFGDGEELFGIYTDPLVWNDAAAQGG